MKQTKIFELEFDPEVFDLTEGILADDLEVLYGLPIVVREHRCVPLDSICDALNSVDGEIKPWRTDVA